MIVPKLKTHMNTVVDDFAKQTKALTVDFKENKKNGEWTITYHLIKIQLVLTKKATMFCPISTLYCRIYPMKNESYFFHVPEIIEYLDEEDFSCYYYPYIESVKRLDACFLVLSQFLMKHFSALNDIAKDTKLYEKIVETKKKEMKQYMGEIPKEPEVDNNLFHYESLVLLVRYTMEGAVYREFLRGDIKRAIKYYEKEIKKGSITNYEKRLLTFIKEENRGYKPIPDECNSLFAFEQLSSSKVEGKGILLSAIVCEIVLGFLFAGIIGLINLVLTKNTLYYAGTPWYMGFLTAGTPAIFGGIAFRNQIRSIIQKQVYQESAAMLKLTGSKGLTVFCNTVFFIALFLMLYINITLPFFSARFYDNYMIYDKGDSPFYAEMKTSQFEDITAVYYSEGVYNDYGDYIDRPSYLIRFKDGTVWNSDGFTSVKKTEEIILPLLEPYYDEVIKIKERNPYLTN